MNARRQQHLTIGALGVAVIALVVAAIGPADADEKAGKTAVKPGKALKIAKKAKRRAVQADQHALQADQRAAQADQRAVDALAIAQAAGPLAYAEVNGSASTGGDTVNDARSKDVSDPQVTHPETGLYCFYLSSTPSNAVASADQATGGVTTLATVRLSDTTFCSGSESASVRLRNVEASTDVNANFFVLFK